MPFSYRCKDIGYDCSFEFRAKEKKDLLPRIKIHTKYAHNVFEMSPDMIKKVEDACREDL
ncbi:MAG: DUF1059 domain-containing protein [Candidatus Thermoplasmatota archaeon]|nr:DUF1059 domain-containing protein [Candidatus Thermoplasmatota archaeon]